MPGYSLQKKLSCQAPLGRLRFAMHALLPEKIASRVSSCRRFFPRLFSITLSLSLTLALLTSLGMSTPAIAAKSDKSGDLFKEVQDLDYGVAIYDYFQQDYFGALSELLVAEKKRSIRHHTDFAKVLRGGIHLSYGMDEEAKNIFYEIIQDKQDENLGKRTSDTQLMGASRRASNENIARAWFYLGKLLYKKGHFIDAGENLEHVEKALSLDLHPEFAFLMDAVSQRIRSNAGDFDYVPDSLPVAVFEPSVPAGSSWSYYQRFNELLERILQHEAVVKGTEEEQALDEYYPLNDGVTDDLMVAEAPDEELEQELNSVVSAPVPENEELAAMPLKKKLRHNARVARALEHLAAKVGASRSLHEVEELMSLKDKIHTTTGFLYLHLAREKRAVRNFKQVRDNSVLVGQALLGYGWAATNNGDFKGALRPLQALAARPMLEQTTHEAHLALPFVYEKMEAHTAALEGYDRAATVMQQELQLLASLREDLESVDPAELHKYYDRESVRWLEATRSNTAEVKKQLFVTRVLKNRLLRLMTQNHFSLMENQRQDIAWLQKKLQQWSVDLDTMRFVIEARQQHSREAISVESRSKIEKRAALLQGRRAALLARLDSIHS
ncbi:MAG: tetratricopeptide repeat protein, partial [Pseudomonadales bacterium]|nr:tetratricopeptide repeat protein [Pseudomonadales bacterium]